MLDFNPRETEYLGTRPVFADPGLKRVWEHAGQRMRKALGQPMTLDDLKLLVEDTLADLCYNGLVHAGEVIEIIQDPKGSTDIRMQCRLPGQIRTLYELQFRFVW